MSFELHSLDITFLYQNEASAFWQLSDGESKAGSLTLLANSGVSDNLADKNIYTSRMAGFVLKGLWKLAGDEVFGIPGSNGKRLIQL